jgi:hypothetical protein
MARVPAPEPLAMIPIAIPRIRTNQLEMMIVLAAISHKPNGVGLSDIWFD